VRVGHPSSWSRDDHEGWRPDHPITCSGSRCTLSTSCSNEYTSLGFDWHPQWNARRSHGPVRPLSMQGRPTHTATTAYRFDGVLAQPCCSDESALSRLRDSLSSARSAATMPPAGRYSMILNCRMLKSSPCSHRRSFLLPTKCCCPAMTDARCTTPRVRATHGDPSGRATLTLHDMGRGAGRNDTSVGLPSRSNAMSFSKRAQWRLQ